MFQRVRGRSYSGALVLPMERVLARAPQMPEHDRKLSKWISRWWEATWLGKTENSDGHLVLAEMEVKHVRCVRRFEANDPRRWQPEDVLSMTVTPWCSKEAPGGAASSAPALPLSRQPVQGIRQRPLTPGCAACARTGQPSHGFRHSVDCRRKRDAWLASQLGPPTLEDAPLVCGEESMASSSATRRRIKMKSSPTVPEEEQAATRALKRPAEQPTEQLDEGRAEDRGDVDDAMATLLETLAVEASDAAATDGATLDDGEWCPASLMREGDIKEMRGLFDRGVLEVCRDRPPGARSITSRMVRRMKAGVCKSRYVLRDFAGKKPGGGELFAATPSLASLRAITAVASVRRRADREPHCVLAADVSQAFIHADIDELICTQVP